MATQKVSLDPYRLQSRRILACIKEYLPAPPNQKVEKASVDEVFLDLSAQIHSILLERFPELQGPPPYDDPTEKLPRPPTTVLDWDTDALVDLDESETEYDDPDWDDIVMLIGSEVVRGVRAAIREKLKYTCSAGIARNKMIAKLGSAHKKPNQQTIVRNRAIQQFLSGFKFTKIRNLGGKLGDEVVSTFGTEQVTDLLRISLDQMKLKIGDDTGSWVYHVIRGEDTSEVNPRTQIKSMLSAKSFQPSINSVEQAHRWLRIFVADIFTRLKEDGVLEHKRRPKTMNLHHRQGAQTRSRQAPIPSGRAIDEILLFDIAKNILAQVVVDGRAWPCSNLSLAVAGFEEGPTGNKGIGGFLLRGDEAKALSTNLSENNRHTSPAEEHQPSKRRKTGNAALPTFFARQSSSRESHEDSDNAGDARFQSVELMAGPEQLTDGYGPASRPSSPSSRAQKQADVVALQSDGNLQQESRAQQKLQQPSIEHFFCDRCKASIAREEQAEHNDWHFARDLQKQENLAPAKTGQDVVPKKKGPGRPSVHSSTPKEAEKGQRRLVFGK